MSPTEDRHFQLPAQVGSLAPILGEVQNRQTPWCVYNRQGLFFIEGLFFDFSVETLAMSPTG